MLCVLEERQVGHVAEAERGQRRRHGETERQGQIM